MDDDARERSENPPSSEAEDHDPPRHGPEPDDPEPDGPEPDGPDREASRCACHPSLDAAGRCPRCDEPRCALCFEDGRDGLCRDCTPADAGQVGRIRPALRIVRLNGTEAPSPWAIAAMVLGKVTGTTMLLLGLAFLSAHEAGPFGGSAWAAFLKTGHPVALTGICACLAVGWVLLRARPLSPQRTNARSQSQKLSK